jgi:hypothetical protein
MFLNARIEVVTMEVVKIKVFCDTMPWNLVKVTTVLEECAFFHLKDSHKMEAPSLSELSLTIDHFTWCYVPEDSAKCMW